MCKHSSFPQIEVIRFEKDKLPRPTRSFLDEIDWTNEFPGALIPSQLDFLEYSRTVTYLGRAITPGEVGCALAHKAAYGRFLSSPSTWCLVLESDAELIRRPNFERLFSFLDTDIPRVVMLGWHSEEELARAPRGRKHPFPPSGTFAYAVNKPAARLAFRDGLSTPGLADWPPAMLSTEFFLWEDRCFRHDDSRASVIGDRSFRRLGFLKKLWGVVLGRGPYSSFLARWRVTFQRDIGRLLIRLRVI